MSIIRYGKNVKTLSKNAMWCVSCNDERKKRRNNQNPSKYCILEDISEVQQLLDELLLEKKEFEENKNRERDKIP